MLSFIAAVLRVFVVSDGFHKLNTVGMFQRVKLLQKYIRDDQKQLVALNVLHQLVISMQHSDCECLPSIPLDIHSPAHLNFELCTIQKPILYSYLFQ